MHIGTFLSGLSRDIILSSELNNMWLLPFLVLQYIWGFRSFRVMIVTNPYAPVVNMAIGLLVL